MFKVGDIVEITEESSATGMLDFVDGKRYAVLETALHTTNLIEPVKVYYLKIRVMNETGVKGWYTASHFKLKEEAGLEKKGCLFKDGQVVWDLLKGKGVVEICHYEQPYPVKVVFEDGDYDFYTDDGKLEPEDKSRRLFFSEPKIEAATEPLFEPTLKGGDVVVVVDKDARHKSYVIKVYEEDMWFVKNDCGTMFNKELFDFYKVGEKIEFS